MKYYTVKEITNQVGMANVHQVQQNRNSVSIQLTGGLIDTHCNACKSGHHTGASVRPRITIKNY